MKRDFGLGQSQMFPPGLSVSRSGDDWFQEVESSILSLKQEEESMKQKVHFIHYENYWVAEAENGAVSQGPNLQECRENIKDAIRELERFRNDGMPSKKEEFIDEIEVGI